MPSEPFYIMSATEIVTGAVFGDAGALAPSDGPVLDPRRTLEDIVRQALLRTPCAVAFSGGRDSSLLLAVATHVARRDGLSEPIAVTRVFPGIEEADEHEWQALVIRHVGVRDWHRIELVDEVDIVGPIATRHLCDVGLLWPPAIAGEAPVLAAVPGGTVMDGEGGDEVLGSNGHRIAPLASVIRHPRRNRRFAGAAAGSLLPAAIRGRRIRTWLAGEPRPWLRPAAFELLLDEVLTADRAQPLAYDASVRMVPTRRAQVLGYRNRQLIAARDGVEIMSPLLHPAFVHAMARHGSWLGPGSRTATLRAIASDLLPEAIISRTSKASFNRCYHAGPSRAFAESWTGRGVDETLVDPDQLRRAWLADDPPAPTSALLQSAWLADRSDRTA
jgi:asparagine synthase (glutamine-hydrolysing)